MNILITFEDIRVSVHFIDVIRMLKHFEHNLYFYNAGNIPYGSYKDLISSHVTILSTLNDINIYDLWIYDLTSWDCDKSVLISKMEEFNGPMFCICEADGNRFLENRTSDKVINKTVLFMRNTLFKDRTKYSEQIRHKLFISTCYITNSQDFKNLSVPFNKKLKRAIFTGSLTGFSEDGDPERYLCRIKVPMALINANISCVYRLHGTNPQWKQKFDECVPDKYKTMALSRQEFIHEMNNSMVILALRGNYHTVNRFYEGLASGGLVFTTRFKEDAEFYGHGDPGIHYIEIEWDGSDVVDKFNYYMNHLDEAESIANNGRKLWEEYSMLDDNKLLPKKVIDYYVNNIYNITGINISKS